MRLGRTTSVAITGVASLTAAVAASLVLAACFDLFHSTSGLKDACELDAQACPAPSEAAVPGTDFCMWESFQASQEAAHACTWLGACQSPLGDNAFGPCMFDALLAYDCAANPSHPARGKTHAFWDCMWQVQSCSDVAACVFPGGAVGCEGTTFTSCGSAGGHAANGDVVIACGTDGGIAVGESCAMRGQTCALDPSGTTATCAGATAAAGGLSCMPGVQTCVDNRYLHSCDTTGIDIGIDCASNGTGSCGGFPPPQRNNAWVACVASGDAGCTPDASAQCGADGNATSCPSGVLETINCTELLQGAPSPCQSGPLASSFDWTSPCQVAQPQCDGGDACNGDTITGCTRGATFSSSCGAQNLGPCVMVPGVAAGTPTAAACSLLDAGSD